jgi:hypothetical protein
MSSLACFNIRRRDRILLFGMGIAGFGDQADRPKGRSDVVEKGDLVSRF